MHNSIECCCCNSTASTLTTTITVDNKENDDDETKHFKNSPSPMTSKVSVLINEPPVVLRQRLNEHVENNISAVTACPSSTATPSPSLASTPRIITTKNKEHQSFVEFGLTEFLGSNVQQIAVTPSPSPRSSPSKLAQDDVTIIGGNSTTSTSSDDKALHSLCQQNGSALNHIAGGGDAGGLLLRRRKDKLPPNTLHLPLRAAPRDDFDEFDLSTPYTPVPTSSTSSTTTPTPSIPTTTSTASVFPSPARKTSSSDAAQLLHWNDMPEYLQFNPYVLSGYRPLQTFKGCLLSLFYWHNETINILSHAIPIVYILIIVPGLMPWETGYRFLSFCHVFGSVAPWCGSFIYHLFMNIEKGENVYYRLLKLDMVGIWVSQSFGALPFVTASTLCFDFKLKWFIIISYYLLALWGLYKALTAVSPWQRRLCFALPFTMRSILMFLRTQGLVGGNRVALWHVYLQDVVSLIGGAIGAMRIPEKWCPGLLDFYLNSHNIMHVLVVVAVYSMYKATLKDLEWISATNCDVFNNATHVEISNDFAAHIEL